MNRRPASGWALVISVATCLAAGALGSIATASSVQTWYPGIAKPSWNPPSAVFGPVWTTLFVLMGIAVWLVWRTPDGIDRRRGLQLFAVQLVLNTTWSFVFFGLRTPGLAAVEIVVLWIAIVATIVVFARVHRGAAALLLPYILWVSFAAVLNFTIWRLN